MDRTQLEQVCLTASVTFVGVQEGASEDVILFEAVPGRTLALKASQFIPPNILRKVQESEAAFAKGRAAWSPVATRQRNFRVRRIAAGLCSGCGINKPNPGRLHCEDCRQKYLDYGKAHRERRRSNGLCIHCGLNPPAPPRLKKGTKPTHCESCLLKERIRQLDVLPAEKERARLAVATFDGHCACCGVTEHRGMGWCLDHDHLTKLFRGIVCFRCNVLLGLVEDSLDKLDSAKAYLANFKGCAA